MQDQALRSFYPGSSKGKGKTPTDFHGARISPNIFEAVRTGLFIEARIQRPQESFHGLHWELDQALNVGVAHFQKLYHSSYAHTYENKQTCESNQKTF